MKTSAVIVLLVCLLAWPSVRISSHTSTGFNAPSLNGEEAIDYLKQQGLHSSLADAIASARYGVYETRHTRYSEPGERFYANNPGAWLSRILLPRQDAPFDATVRRRST